jgi:hypothetical protein
MEYVEEYRGVTILKDKETGFFKTSANGLDCSDINFIKYLIDIKANKA